MEEIRADIFRHECGSGGPFNDGFGDVGFGNDLRPIPGDKPIQFCEQAPEIFPKLNGRKMGGWGDGDWHFLDG